MIGDLFLRLKNIFMMSGIITEQFLMRFTVFLTFFSLFLLFAWFLYGLKTKKISFNGLSRKIAVFLVIIFLLGLTIRIFSPAKFGAGGGDELFYVEVAEEVWSSGRYALEQPLREDRLFFKPYYLYIHLLAPLTGFLDPLFAGRLLNILIGSLTIVSSFFMTKKFFDEKTGLVAGFLVATLPLGIHLSHTTETQTLSVFLMTLMIPVFKNYVDRGGFYWGFGSSIFLAGLVLTRSFNWIFVPVFILLFLSERIFSLENFKNYVVYGVTFCFLTIVSFLQNIPFGFREGGGETYFFNVSNIPENFLGILEKTFESLYYIPFTLASLAGIYLALKNKRDVKLLLAPLAVYTFLITSYEPMLQAYPMTKFYYMTFVLLIPFVSYFFIEISKSKRFKVLAITLLVFLGSVGVFESLNYYEEKQTKASSIIMENIEENHSECGVITFDARPLRVVSDKVPADIPHEKKDMDWFRENFGECLVYARIYGFESPQINWFEEKFPPENPVIEEEPLTGEFGSSIYVEAYRYELE